MISVVIPAHNEAAVIDRCLSSMLRGTEPGELEVIVVCNGCTDATADRARGHGDAVQVLETDTPSKSNALNLGDQVARGFPRFYVDADIVLPIHAIRQVAEVLKEGVVLGASPRMRVRLDEASWAIRAYYHVWTRLPYVTDNMLGSGVYAVSKEGRRRFGKFPDIIADDCFVRLLFESHERLAVDGVYFEMTPPATLRDLVHVETRRRAGASEMRDLYGERFVDEGRRQLGELLSLCRNPRQWPTLAVYGYVKVATRLHYALKERQGLHRQWNRDDSSRLPAVDATATAAVAEPIAEKRPDVQVQDRPAA